jgi:hypothetical protein
MENTPMKLTLLSLSIALLAAAPLAQASLFGKDQIYRCGNAYTDKPTGPNCQRVKDDKVTVVPSELPVNSAQSDTKPSNSGQADKDLPEDSPERAARSAALDAILRDHYGAPSDHQGFFEQLWTSIKRGWHQFWAWVASIFD